MFGTSATIVWLRAVRSILAWAFGAYPSLSTASITRRLVSGATTSGFCSARDTVATDVRAAAATWRMFRGPVERRARPLGPLRADLVMLA